ncbi:MAG: hypothetical protein K0M56_04050 [Kaistella sp.]|nr:hypothetical protein [Kaistella sp.]
MAFAFECVANKAPDPETDFKNYLDKAGFSNSVVEKEFQKGPPTSGLYYLHGDHLGTGSLVTDSNGETTQFFLNLPFGETMAEQNLQGAYDNPYKFNAKELDSETGLYYYGARYYNPKLSVWYGVDPLSEKMPSWSPYSYAFDNPVRFIDPDGMEPVDDHFNQFGKYLYTDNKKTNNIVIDFQNPINGKISSAPWHSQQLKDYTFTKDNLYVLANIANHYAKDAGVDLNNLRGGSVSIAMAEFKVDSYGKMDGIVRRFNGGDYKADALATGDFASQKLNIMVNNGSVSDLYNDKYNMISTLSHEGGKVSHLKYDPKNWYEGQEVHMKIYENQMKSPVFQKTTKDYKNKMRENYGNTKFEYNYYKKKYSGK